MSGLSRSRALGVISSHRHGVSGVGLGTPLPWVFSK